MNVDAFWTLLERTTSPEDLHRALATLDQTDLATFERSYDAIFHGSFDWGLWGAAYIIDGGCSDDLFDYFRSYLISMGRAAFETALRTPDSLSAYDIAQSADWELWMSPTMAVNHKLTGRYEFVTELEPELRFPRQPSGDEWDESELAARMPRLAAKYGWTAG
jgi:hypothetical protein